MAKNLTDILVGVSSGVLKVSNGGTGAGTLPTGVLKGAGTGAITAATAGIDFSAGTSTLGSGILYSTTSTGALSIATAGTHYASPETSSTFTTLQTFNLIKTVNTHEAFQTLTQAASGTLSIDFTNGNVIYLNQGANITGFTLTGITTALSFSFNIIRKNTAGSALSITWGTAFKWPNATTPTLTNTLNSVDVFTFITFDAGTTIYSVTAGSNFG